MDVLVWSFGRKKDEDEAEYAGYRARQLYQILLQDYRPTVPTDAPLDDNEFCYSEVELSLAAWQNFGPLSHWVDHRSVKVALTNNRIFLRYLDGDGAWGYFWHGKIAHLTVDLQQWRPVKPENIAVLVGEHQTLAERGVTGASRSGCVYPNHDRTSRQLQGVPVTPVRSR